MINSATAASDAQVYTDLNGLNSIKRLGKSDKDAALREVAKQFESMFTRQMLKNMRSANEVFAKDGLFDSNESKFYRDMADDQLAVNLSSGNGMGLANQLYNQMREAYVGRDLPAEKTELGALPERKDFFVTVPGNQGSDTGTTAQEPLRTIKLGAKDSIASSPEDFVQKLLPYAEKAAEKLNLDPKVLVAQAALETGWGGHVIADHDGQSSFNLFNIKADQRWDGNGVRVPTVEYDNQIARRETADFRAYDSIQESFDDYVNFLQSNGRYQQALNNTENGEVYMQELQNAGYATDPFYAEKVTRVMQSEPLQTAFNISKNDVSNRSSNANIVSEER